MDNEKKIAYKLKEIVLCENCYDKISDHNYTIFDFRYFIGRNTKNLYVPFTVKDEELICSSCKNII
jgi:hypothetical protein